MAALSVVAGDQGVNAYTGPDRDRSDDQLDREEYGKRGQPLGRKLTNKVAVHNIIKRLDQLRRHDRRCDAQQHRPNPIAVKKIVFLFWVCH